MTKPNPPEKRKRGPKPEHLKLAGEWEDAVKTALRKPPPPRLKPKSNKDNGPR